MPEKDRIEAEWGPIVAGRFRSGGDCPVVALDIDGTLGDYHAHFLWFATLWFGRPFPNPTEVNPGMRLSDFMGIQHHEYRECKLSYRQGGLKRFMPAYNYASELTRDIRSLGAQVWICTSRPAGRLDNIDPDTREWLRRNGIAYDAVIWEGLAEDSPDKYGDLVSQVGPHRVVAAVDDLPEQVSNAINSGISTVYIRDQPYNRYLELPATRVHDLRSLSVFIAKDIDDWKAAASG